MGFRYTYQNFMMEELIPRSNKSKNCNAQKITYKNANRHDTFWRYKNIALIDFDCADKEIRFLMFPRIQIHNLSRECIRNAFKVRDPRSVRSGDQLIKISPRFSRFLGPGPRFSNSSCSCPILAFLNVFGSGSSFKTGQNCLTWTNQFWSIDPLLETEIKL